MKSVKQMDDHEPSDLIPLHDGMTISFINYELQVNIQDKSAEEIANSQFEPLGHAPIKPVQSSQRN
jgi:hypothetical protein